MEEAVYILFAIVEFLTMRRPMWIGLALGSLAAAILYFLMPPSSKIVTACAALMAGGYVAGLI